MGDKQDDYEELFCEITARQFSTIMGHLMEIVEIMRELVTDPNAEPVKIHLVKKDDPE